MPKPQYVILLERQLRDAYTRNDKDALYLQACELVHLLREAYDQNARTESLLSDYKRLFNEAP